MTIEKKHFYTWCAGLVVHALLTCRRVTVFLKDRQADRQTDR